MLNSCIENTKEWPCNTMRALFVCAGLLVFCLAEYQIVFCFLVFLVFDCLFLPRKFFFSLLQCLHVPLAYSVRQRQEKKRDNFKDVRGKIINPKPLIDFFSFFFFPFKDVRGNQKRELARQPNIIKKRHL